MPKKDVSYPIVLRAHTSFFVPHPHPISVLLSSSSSSLIPRLIRCSCFPFRFRSDVPVQLLLLVPLLPLRSSPCFSLIVVAAAAADAVFSFPASCFRPHIPDTSDPDVTHRHTYLLFPCATSLSPRLPVLQQHDCGIRILNGAIVSVMRMPK